MSKHRVLSFKPQLRLEWQRQDGQHETEQPDHSASLCDSITSSTRIRFSVHTGRIYWETLPPGVLEKQIDAGGTVTSGNMTWTAKPDAYLAGLKKVQSLIDRSLLTGPAVPYVTNSLA